ncbi:MAG TPA: MlaD family protein [Caulobacteraceae bacterium]|jgi:phospholipid/cholesterol/gamma-HCH transport system substrate-binding protein
MERNANYFFVGLVATLLLIGLVVFFVWLGGSKFRHDYDIYDIVFRGPVHGVAQGGEVDFNGIKVGAVTKISLDPKDSQFVIARVNIAPDVPIRADSYASLEPQGITGVNYIQITAGTPTKPLLRDTVPEGEIPRLPGHRDAISDLLSNGASIAQEAIVALDQLNKVVSDKNVKTVTAVLDDLHAVTSEAKAHKSVIEDAQKALQDSDAAVKQIGELAHTTNGLVSSQGKTTFTKLDSALDEMKGATQNLRVLLQKIQGPTVGFAQTGLPQLTGAIQSLQSAAEHMDRVLGEVEANPRGLIAKPPAKEVQVRP